MAQAISIVLIIGAIIVIVYRRQKGLSDERYLDNQEVTN
jgi:phosphatidylglycerol:prolipoprotein diacylglycerol transferase